MGPFFAQIGRPTGGGESTGWDAQRGCRRKLRKTLDRFLGYPVQVVELTEHYPKRKQDCTVTCWIVTTDVEQPLEEVREAAHQHWQIENGIFKGISHLAGTRTFNWMLRAHTLLFAALRMGIKDTWLNVFSRIDEVLGRLPCAFAAIA